MLPKVLSFDEITHGDLVAGVEDSFDIEIESDWICGLRRWLVDPLPSRRQARSPDCGFGKYSVVKVHRSGTPLI